MDARDQSATDSAALRDEVRMLADLLDAVFAELEGAEAHTRLKRVRELAQRRRQGESAAEQELIELIASLDTGRAGPIVQALSTFFDLANLAEDRHRVRVLRDRERKREPEPRAESIGEAIEQLAASGMTAEQMQALLSRLSIELVFTAHPTEAKRKSVREKIRDLRDHLHEADQQDLLLRERKRLMDRIRADLTALWQTDTLRERKPTVLEEVERGLFFSTTLWEVLPDLYRDVHEALAKHYPDQAFDVPPFLQFGSWIGGDRDGNPNVTAAITRHTLMRLREVALERHYEQCKRLRRSLSMSQRRAGIPQFFLDALDAARAQWPATAPMLEPIAQTEPYRLWLRLMEWRIEQTRKAEPFASAPQGAYANSGEMLEDLRLIRRSLDAHPGGSTVSAMLEQWISQAQVFGFHMMRLDIRQESSVYHAVMDEVLQAAGACEGYAQLDEVGRQDVLTRTMGFSKEMADEKFSDQARETLALFRLLAEVMRMNGPDSLGAHVISMTHQPSDVLAVLWLSEWAQHHRP